MQWELTVEHVLVAFERLDLGHGNIEDVVESNDLR